MIQHLHLLWWKATIFTAWWVSFTTVAVTEAFLGQMMIALVVALIGATPPTLAIVLMARNQSRERAAASKSLLEGQKEMHVALDGKLDRLNKAETSLAKAEGVVEGTEQERVRVALEPGKVVIDTPAAPPVVPAEIKIVNDKTEPVPTTPGVKPKE